MVMHQLIKGRARPGLSYVTHWIHSWPLKMQVLGNFLHDKSRIRSPSWQNPFPAMTSFYFLWLLFNEFIRCFHQFFSPILSTNLSQFEPLKKKTNLLLVQNMFFFLSLPVEKEIITNIRRFGIRNRWNYLMSPSIFLLHRTLFCSAKVWKLPLRWPLWKCYVIFIFLFLQTSVLGKYYRDSLNLFLTG